MKEILLKYLLFTTLFLGGIYILQSSSYYYGPYGNFSHKLEHLLTNQEYYNGLAIGSSRVLRHVDCDIFKEKTGQSLFNLGESSMGFSESIFNLEKLIDQGKIDQLDFVVFHMVGELWGVFDKNLNTLRANYYHNFHNSSYRISHSIQRSKFKIASNICHSNISNLLGIGTISNSFQNIFLQAPDHYSKKVQNHGYIPYNSQSKKLSKYIEDKKLKKFMPGANFRSPNKLEPLSYSQNIMINELDRIKEKLNEKNIELVLLFDPNISFHKHMDNHNIMYIGDSADIPEIYEIKNYYNPGHLNKDGATIYSTIMSNKFNELKLSFPKK